jgi:hypothetical protein
VADNKPNAVQQHPKLRHKTIVARPIAPGDYLQYWDHRAGEKGWERIPLELIDHQVTDDEKGKYFRLAQKPIVEKEKVNGVVSSR